MDYDYIAKALKNTLSLDDTFEFSCKECGKCCRGRTDLQLTPYDVYNLAKYFNVLPKDIISKYCNISVDEYFCTPAVKFTPKLHNNVCPLLRNGKCSTHSLKPFVCRLFPLGRACDIKGNAIYFCNETTCNDKKHKYTVREWLNNFNVPIKDEIAETFAKNNMQISAFLKSKRRIPDAIYNVIFEAIIMLLYLAYDIDKDFLPQLEKNCENLNEIIKDFTGKGYKK